MQTKTYESESWGTNKVTVNKSKLIDCRLLSKSAFLKEFFNPDNNSADFLMTADQREHLQENHQDLTSITDKDEFFRQFYAFGDLSFKTINHHQAQWLLDTSVGNRAEVRTNSEKLTSAMAGGYFFAGCDALGCNTRKQLSNGHHRLESQIKTRTTHKYAVRQNMTDEEVANIDQGSVRSKQAGITFNPKFREDYGDKLSGQEGAIVTAMLARGGQRKITLNQKQNQDAILAFAPALKWWNNAWSENKTIRSRGLKHASVASVFCRAWMHLHHYDDVSKEWVINQGKELECEKLNYAIKYLICGAELVFSDGDPYTNTSTINVLRDWLTATKGSGFTNTKRIYLITNRVLHDFLNDKVLSRITDKSGAKTEMFPIEDIEKKLTRKVDYREHQINVLGLPIHRAMEAVVASLEIGSVINKSDFVKLINEREEAKGQNSSTVGYKITQCLKVVDEFRFDDKILIPEIVKDRIMRFSVCERIA